MANKRNYKLAKGLVFRGKLIKIFNPKATKTSFDLTNKVTDFFLKGRKSSRFFSCETTITKSDGEPMRMVVYSSTPLETNIVSALQKCTISEIKDEKIKNDLKNEPEISVIPGELNKNRKKPIILWIHGGGYATGVPEQDFVFIDRMLETCDCIVVAPDYTLSMEKPYPCALNDCYDALLWVKENARALGANDSQIFVGGDSAGGGLCAAICLYARDKGEVNIAFQMPLYPMLDDRPTRTNADNHAPGWDTPSNIEAWKLYLGDLYGKDVPYYAAPARATDYSNLPPALTYVGDIEPFTAETEDYVENLRNCGIEVKFKLYKGCFHGFDVFGYGSKVAKDAELFFIEGFLYAVNKYFAKQK